MYVIIFASKYFFGGFVMFESLQAEKLYNERLNRYVTAMNGGTPDRIPIRFFFQEAAAKYCGLTTQQVACDYRLAFDCTRKMAKDMNVDACMLNAIWSNYGVGKSLGLKYMKIPGVDVSIDSVTQYSEPENEDDLFLHADEYDEFINDPTSFIFEKWLVRASYRLTNGKVNAEHNMALIGGAMSYANYMNSFGEFAAKLKADSIVSANAGMIKAPFDILADKFRGYLPLAIDSIERPEIVYKACEALMPHIVANALASADPDQNVPITLWAHRGCVPFISFDTFDKIYFATLKPVLEEITSKGYQVLFYGEGNWEPHYDSLLTLRENALIYHLDKGEPKNLRKLKEKFSVSGGLSYDVLARGDEHDVKNHMKELFAAIKNGGGYILDATALMLNDIKHQNIETAVNYTMEHGVYSQTSKPRKKAFFDAPSINDNTKTAPNTTRPWEVESKNYQNLEGDIELVKNSWNAVDILPYNYVWTTVLW